MPYSFPTQDEFNALVARVVTLEDDQFPDAPMDFTATIENQSTGRVALDWTDSPEPGVSYYVWDQTGWSHVNGTVSSNAIILLSPGTYTLWVTATFKVGQSRPSNTVTVTI